MGPPEEKYPPNPHQKADREAKYLNSLAEKKFYTVSLPNYFPKIPKSEPPAPNPFFRAPRSNPSSRPLNPFPKTGQLLFQPNTPIFF